jgi:phosphatidylglycerophosphate synthase
MLDPLVDKVLVCGTFVCFAVVGQPEFLFNWSQTSMQLVRWFIAAVLIAREGYVTILRHAAEAKGIDFRAVASGKIKMLIQSFTIGTILVKAAHVRTATWGHWFTLITFIIMLIATVVSGVSATHRVKK